MQEGQWEDALSVVQTLREEIVEDGGWQEKSVEEAGTTVTRMRDMGGVGERAGYDNAKLWTASKGPYEQCNEWKVKREKEAPRKWQAPYERKVTLQELAERNVNRMF